MPDDDHDPDTCPECGNEMDPTLEIRSLMIKTAAAGCHPVDAVWLLTREIGWFIGCLNQEDRSGFRKMVLEMMDKATKSAVVALCDA